MDLLTQLFASKPISYPGVGMIYNGDTRGNVVTSQERDVEVLKRFNVNDGGGSTTHPFKCPGSTDGSTASSVVAGAVNGVTATGLSLTIINSGTKYVYLDVTYTQNLSSNNYVMGISGSVTCAVATGSSVPSDTSTHLYRHIATYVNGVKTVQSIISSMQVVVRDDGSGSAVSTAIWGAA
jgi:hypothetical protein